MGEIYSLSDEELTCYRNKILQQLNKYKRTKSVENLTLFLIWLYEFVEMFAVNCKNEQGKLKRAKDFFDMEIVIRLFRIRGSLVHKCYSITDNQIVKFYNDYSNDLFELMKAAGFEMSEDQTSAAAARSSVF